MPHPFHDMKQALIDRETARRRAREAERRRLRDIRRAATWVALVVALGAAVLLLPNLARGQWGGFENPASATAEFEPKEARPGEAVRLVVTADYPDENYIYAMYMTETGDGPVPTEVNLSDESPDILVPRGAWQEDEPVTKWDRGFERDVQAHPDAPVEFHRTFRIDPEASPGTYTIEGALWVQVCTETTCLPPEDRPFTAELTVLEGDPVPRDQWDDEEIAEEPAGAVAQDVPEGGSPSAGVAQPVPAPGLDTVSGQIATQSLTGLFLFALVFGLIALATPCVFPMIPITISFFTQKAAKSTLQASWYAGAYVLSIIAGFTLIGFGFSLLMLLLGGGVESSGFANRIASDPWINLFFFLLYLFFALALFEVFSLQLPSGLANRLNQSAAGRSDILGIAMKAMVFVIISFTCTAPLLGVLIVQTLTGDWLRPLVGMLGFATGFATPFFFLALAPQMLGSLPRAGAWLYSIKVVMGFLVLAAAFKFLSNVDLVLRREDMILTRELLLAVWATIAAVTALYLFGLIRLSGEAGEDGPPRVGTGRLLTGLTFGTVALYLSAGMFGGRLHSWIDAYLPPDLSPRGAVVASGENDGGLPPSRTATGGDMVSAGFSWFSEVEPAIEHAAATGRNVFIDFTGYTCTNCRLMERDMFPRPEVASLMEEYVRVKLYIDDRERGAERRAYQAENFGTVTMPYYVVMTPEGEVLGEEAYTTNVERFVGFLERGVVAQEVAAAP